jgi:hypothetical protein
VWEVCCARLLGCIFPFGSPTASPWRSSGFAHSPHDEVALSRRRCTHLIDHYYCNKRFNIAKGVLEEDLRRPSHYHNATTTLCLSLPLRVRPRGQNPRYCAVVSPPVSQSLSVSLSGTDYELEGRRFESCRARPSFPRKYGIFLWRRDVGAYRGSLATHKEGRSYAAESLSIQLTRCRGIGPGQSRLEPVRSGSTGPSLCRISDMDFREFPFQKLFGK